MIRWIVMNQSNKKDLNYTSDSDFEGGIARGKIKLSKEDIKGLNLA